MSYTEENNLDNAIAIVAMGGRFPGAKTIEEFWNNLDNGVESVKFFNRDQLIEMGIDKHLLNNPRFVAADAVLSDIDKFDASFFDYSAREAEVTDPQHRLFLETAWEVMEKAGYTSEQYDGRVAVFAGANLSGYMIRNLNSNPGLVDQLGSFKIMLSNGQDFLATKVSHKMNLKGPSVNVNTLCSSSMVALHYACKSLLDFDSDLALAGAVSIQISRNEAFFYQEGGIGSSDGHVRAFDSKANGTVSGSGLGIVALKRLEDAIADGDRIEAVIRGTGINNDGAIKNSYTAPSVDGQSECIAEAIAMSGVDPETISYIDAHGTGTNLGDPIEIAALTKAYRAYTDKNQFCAIGSVKTNIGHLVHAGGIASVIKTVLAMQHHVIPASLNFEEPNPKIDFVNTPFYINNRRRKWKAEKPLRAAVSSFGIGGTNTHAILEEAPAPTPSERSLRDYQLVTLSAKTATALEKMTSNLAEFLKVNPSLNLADVAFTLGVGRAAFSHRRTLIATSVSNLIEKLENPENTDTTTTFRKAREIPITFSFSERLENFKGLASLADTEPTFKENFQALAEIINSKCGIDVGEIVFKNAGYSEKSAIIATFAVEYSIAKLLTEWGIAPKAAFGEGKGAITAKAVLGELTLEEACEKFLDDNFEDKEEIVSENDSLVFNFSNEGILSCGENGKINLAAAAAKFFSEGGHIDFNAYYKDESRKRVLLPTYPFEEQRYWIEPGKRNAGENGEGESKLEKRKRPELETEFKAPETEVEKKITAICEDILGYDKIGINDDFFELGGHSLLAVAFIARLRAEFSRDISLESLFENTTVAKIAPFFSDEENDSDNEVGTI